MKAALRGRRVILGPSGFSEGHSACFVQGCSALNAPSVHQKMLDLRAVGWHHRGGPSTISMRLTSPLIASMGKEVREGVLVEVAGSFPGFH